MSEWVRDYIGRPYDPVEFNCWTLVCEIEQKFYGRDLPPYAGANGSDWKKAVDYMRGADITGLGWKKTCDPVDGDVVMLSHGRLPTHTGVFVAGGILHCLENCGVIFSKITPMFRQEWPLRQFYTVIDK